MLRAMAIPTAMVRRVLLMSRGESGPINAADARGVLEIACLAVAADGTIADEERDVLHTLSAELGALSANEIDTLVQRATDKTREEQVERLRAVADSLSNDSARNLAYMVSVLTAMADLAASDEEFEFDLDVQEALGLSADTAASLAGSVHEALTSE
jgi:tellurite resistance protein